MIETLYTIWGYSLFTGLVVSGIYLIARPFQ